MTALCLLSLCVCVLVFTARPFGAVLQDDALMVIRPVVTLGCGLLLVSPVLAALALQLGGWCTVWLSLPFAVTAAMAWAPIRRLRRARPCAGWIPAWLHLACLLFLPFLLPAALALLLRGTLPPALGAVGAIAGFALAVLVVERFVTAVFECAQILEVVLPWWNLAAFVMLVTCLNTLMGCVSWLFLFQR